jgi:hypothetical protein
MDEGGAVDSRGALAEDQVTSDDESESNMVIDEEESKE